MWRVTDKKNHSVSLIFSAVGVVAIIFILTAIWFVHQRHLNELRHTIQDGELAVEKMGLIVSMIETARARTRLTNKMTFIEDVFEKDEISMQLDRYASKFAVLRQQLVNLPLTPEERRILESQRNVIKPALQQQRLAAELAMSDLAEDIYRAKSILIDQVYPGQGKIIDHFMQLLDLQKQKINDASEAANQHFDDNQRLQTLLFILVSSVVVGIAFVAVKRLSRTDDLEHEASHDELTGLLNRRDFERKVTHVLENCTTGESHVFGLIDLDNFKKINDSAGHIAGDEFLKRFSQRVKENFRRGDLLARIGGDEFAFLLVDADTRNIDKITNSILNVVQDVVFEWNGEFHRVGASIGVVAVDGGDSMDYKTHYRHADHACYKAKANGKNRIVIYSEAVTETDDNELTAIIAGSRN
jgi:diguanylate cyclase (GGDEF)-like protein